MIRKYKGNSKIVLLNDYVLLDIETTGLDPEYDEIIEIAAIKVVNGIVTDSFSQLIKPSMPISNFISTLTGITNEMLSVAPSITEILPKFINFASDMNIVGHNINFDINFIYDNCLQILGIPFKNDYVDTLRLSRKVFPELENHKLLTICNNLGIESAGYHRASIDCKLTFKLYEKIKEYIYNKKLDLLELFRPKRNKLKAKDITTFNQDFDETHLLFKKNCVFTGTLSIPRKEAMQLVVDLDGHCEDNVTKRTNYLILGNIDYSKCKGNKSTKYKKAEELILNGNDLKILSENVFFDLVGQNNTKKIHITEKELNKVSNDINFEEHLDEIMTSLNINYIENKDYQRNEKLACEYNRQAMEMEQQQNLKEAIRLYEKSAYYTHLGNHPYDRLIILYKKCGNNEKMVSILKFVMFVFYKIVNPHRADRINKLKKYYLMYINQ